ncbi:hypothetical protein [Candidatus Albibeggiatoa sp. nov. BB20]|uniref:hypothetical protein n=1 Tax=Candidatus Albibeggiatoa sp. nov. BB20 TaxID=3162723 RepID=UPI0033659481
MNSAAILKSSFRYLVIASLLTSFGMMTACKRSNLLDDNSTANNIAPLQGSGQIDCDDVNNRAECKTIDDRATP